VVSVPSGSLLVVKQMVSPAASVTFSGATSVTATFAGTEIVLEAVLILDHQSGPRRLSAPCRSSFVNAMRQG